jgi:hypothetical protein
MPLRLRQLVFASDKHSDIQRLQTVLGLKDGYVDPGVGEFGLTNGVFALGEQFLEVVVPTQSNTAVNRFIERTNATGGYMAIFQTSNITRVRTAADRANIRRIWNIDLPDISASHFHPSDMGAAIISIDEPRPPEAWRWGGPDWARNTIEGAIIGIDVSSPTPGALESRWNRVLCESHEIAGVNFIAGEREMITAFHLSVTKPEAVLFRAQQARLAVQDNSFWFRGVQVFVQND